MSRVRPGAPTTRHESADPMGGVLGQPTHGAGARRQPPRAVERGMITTMKVRRIGSVGVRTDRVAETTAFLRDVVGLPAATTLEDWTVTQLPPGRWDFVEVFENVCVFQKAPD